ncbi:TonB-dependent receptor [Sphingopyxis sp. PAMC25046]|uniref:TonB-dependent receptor n=1 Tax=Sphingopyxis sp. PAMC25046 TaxID=2565556 RepID=UPI00109E015F|nr:TonB-dependent receptor [Sphingopyxis sp. PAMC25046]QCB53050.1 TonB-dependent receptor [Sphingopyxis sp. PAMC25046]
MKPSSVLPTRAALLASAALFAAMPVWAQEAPAEVEGEPAAAVDAGDEILVTGTRATQRSSIEFKRAADVVVDGLVSEEIGATPDNSVGDTLERIVGVSADRFKGNANELSVRGLGPTLSFSTFNGREVSTAGPDRSVAFQQFPSELVNGVLVYKTQRADFLEGGVGGVIELRSMKPLDYGKRRIQFEVRGDFQPQDDDVYQHDGLGYRANFSYTDQYETGLGDIGVSIGYQRQDTSAPEDYYNGNSTFQLCNTSADNPWQLTGNAATQAAAGANVNCTFAEGPRTANGVTVGETIGDHYFPTSSRSFRTQKTSEIRDGLIGAIQWRPSPEFEIAIDGQYSKRRSREDRNVLGIPEGLRGIEPLVIGNGSNGYSPGALISYRGNSNIENQLETRQRNETYKGGGLGLIWTPDRWTVSFDGSYSDSHRTETQKATRMRSNRRVGYTLTYLDDDVVPNVEFEDFDITDHDLFLTTAANSVYARNRFVTDRRDRIWAGRLDIERELDGFITSVKVGGRYSDHHRTNDNARNNDLNTLATIDGTSPAELIAQANQNCRVPFTTTSYMQGMGTNVTRWATFDNDCLFRTFTGGDDALPYPADGRDPSDIDVTERIYALYGLANFESQAGSVPFSGNIGLRWVKTDITSIGYRQPYVITIDTAGDSYSVDPDPNGELLTNRAKGSYNYFLPSANIAFDLSQEVKLRLAAYRAIARSGIESFGAGIRLNPSAGTGLDNIIFDATTGNPNLKPLRAWNLDASLELYASRDTLLSIAGYYKWAKGTVISAEEPIPTDVTITTIRDGGAPVTETVTIAPVAPTNDSETRHLYGIEATASHAFTWLPDPLDGLGIQGSVNRAFANFEYPDTSPIADYVDPANLIGLSKWTASGSVWFEKWGLSLRANLRYRSGYYKPNSGTNREIRGATYINLSAQYNLTDNVQLKLQALNITGTNDIMYKGGYDSIAEVSRSGTQYFFGFRVRL